MPDRELVAGVLQQIDDALGVIAERFALIRTPSDFVATPTGREKRDSICLVLVAIGESLKTIDRLTEGVLLAQYPDIDWKGAKAMRDIIAHRYFDIDEEIVFDVCARLLPQVAVAIHHMRQQQEQ